MVVWGCDVKRGALREKEGDGNGSMHRRGGEEGPREPCLNMS